MGFVREANPILFDKYLDDQQKSKKLIKEKFEQIKNEAGILMIYMRNRTYEMNGIVVEESKKAIKETVKEFKNVWK